MRRMSGQKGCMPGSSRRKIPFFRTALLPLLVAISDFDTIFPVRPVGPEKRTKNPKILSKESFAIYFRCIRIWYISRRIHFKNRNTVTPEIIFKCLAVLYVDPQNLMTNRRNRPTGAGVGFEAQQCRQEGINTSMTYIVSP